MTFWAYMLHCRGGAYYVGHSDNLDYRIAQHQAGMVPGYMADRLPVTLVWSQSFPTRIEALETERRIKGWSRAKKMVLIRGDWNEISTLAKGKNGPSTSSGRTEKDITNPLKTVRPEPVEGRRLICHPDMPCLAMKTIKASVARNAHQRLLLSFQIFGDMRQCLLPSPADPDRTDGLWQTTCCELFLRRDGEPDYLEFNFSPSSQWAAYHFASYREGAVHLSMPAAPEIALDASASHLALEVILTLPCEWQKIALTAALSAVIEETDGTKSYWALRHPSGQPDFHHPDCFALTLGAPEGA